MFLFRCHPFHEPNKSSSVFHFCELEGWRYISSFVSGKWWIEKSYSNQSKWILVEEKFDGNAQTAYLRNPSIIKTVSNDLDIASKK